MTEWPFPISLPPLDQSEPPLVDKPPKFDQLLEEAGEAPV